MSRSSESNHWYDTSGKPVYTVIAKNGNEVNTTLAHARVEKYVPSVSMINSQLSKPGLERYLKNEIIKASWGCEVTGSYEEYEYAVRLISEAEGKLRREEGTAIHTLIEEGFLGKTNIYYENVRQCLDAEGLYAEWTPERSFAHKLGYGGKCDLSGHRLIKTPKGFHSERIVVDYKTKDFKDGDKAKSFIYDEHGMQLSAYGLGLYNREDAVRVNIFVRPKDGKCLPYIHPSENDKKDLEMFKCLLKFWQLKNNYDSSF